MKLIFVTNIRYSNMFLDAKYAVYVVIDCTYDVTGGSKPGKTCYFTKNVCKRNLTENLYFSVVKKLFIFR